VLFVLQRRPIRLLASVCAAALAAFLFRHLGWAATLVAAWDGACAVELTTKWAVILRSGPEETRAWVLAGVSGKWLQLAVVTCAGAVCLLLSFTLMHQASQLASGITRELLVLLCLATVVGSWLLTHTSYTMRYAQHYYRRGGFKFPGERAPDYWDFVYYAFTIGMCFEVADITITGHTVRRLTIKHAVVSFAFNTTIVALAMNLVADRLL
jgi:uncharacterized membrane protein